MSNDVKLVIGCMQAATVPVEIPEAFNLQPGLRERVNMVLGPSGSSPLAFVSLNSD